MNKNVSRRSEWGACKYMELKKRSKRYLMTTHKNVECIEQGENLYIPPKIRREGNYASAY
jgi:hypothetical protein